MDEDYLNLFKKLPQGENLNEKVQQDPNENLQKQNVDPWQRLNEVSQDAQKYRINENTNDGWGNLDIQIETRVNGIPNHNTQQLQPNSRRHRNIGQNLNGLDSFLDDDDLREVIKQPKPVEQGPAEIMAPPVVENIEHADVVSVEMFENMNSNALLTLANKKVQSLNPNNATNVAQPTQVRFLGS